MIVRLFNRAFGDAMNRPSVKFEVTRYAKTTYGGCSTAEIVASGDERALWQLLNLMRCGVEIWTDTGMCVWWGLVTEVEVTLGEIVYGKSIDRFANRVAVAYSYTAPGGSTSTRATTTWAQDDYSIGEYGYKELLDPLNDAAAAQANARRDGLLSARANPLPTMKLGEGRRTSARLVCRGWNSTLAYRFYSSVGAQSIAAFEVEPENITVDVGASSANTYVGQSFIFTGDPSARYTPTLVRVKWVKLGNPTDNLFIDICQSGGDGPGMILATYTALGSSLPPTHTWVDIPFDVQIGMTANTTYWIQARRSGAIDAANHYRLAVQSGTDYANGVLKAYNGSSWLTQPGDALFKVTLGTVRETTQQIIEIVTAIGQFITGIDIEDVSGIYTSHARDGDSSGLQYVTELISGGMSTGQRYLWEVTRERRLRVYKEPDVVLPTHNLTRDGRLLTAMMQPVKPELCTVGVWARVQGVPSGANDTPLFIESAEYQPRSNKITMKARETDDGFDVFKVGRG